jgi:diacylglycerol kinase family enzyme
VVVFSGDGTINEAVNALAGTDVALAVLPGGATNVLVRALDLPTDPVECTGVLIPKALDDEAIPLHLGRADGRYFAVNCGAGIDAAAMRRLDRKYPESKAKFDRAAFQSVAWELLVGYAGKTPDLSVSIDGTDAMQALSVMVGRTDPYTFYKEHGLRMTPDASLEKGLDVLAIRKLSRRNVPRIAWQVFGSARHVHGRDLEYTHDASHVTVTAAAPFPVQVDGDPLGDHTKLEIELAREALWVVA